MTQLISLFLKTSPSPFTKILSRTKESKYIVAVQFLALFSLQNVHTYQLRIIYVSACLSSIIVLIVKYHSAFHHDKCRLLAIAISALFGLMWKKRWKKGEFRFWHAGIHNGLVPFPPKKSLCVYAFRSLPKNYWTIQTFKKPKSNISCKCWAKYWFIWWKLRNILTQELSHKGPKCRAKYWVIWWNLNHMLIVDPKAEP